MPRPVKRRKVCLEPTTNIFGPVEEVTKLEKVILYVDEYETIRLIDFKNFTQEECAQKMNVARTTVQAIYSEARKKIADCLVNGKILKIQGGNYSLCDGGEENCSSDECRKKRQFRKHHRKNAFK